jgi:hypothetical protein
MKKNALIRLVEKFIDHDCTVKILKQFCYQPENKVIGISLIEDNSSNSEWAKYLKDTFNFTLTQENLFAMSILHELGHHYTVDYFENDEWIEQATEKALGDLTGSARQQAYFNLPIEKVATEFAVKVYNANERDMRAWNHRLNCAVRHFEKLHSVKSSLTSF